MAKILCATRGGQESYRAQDAASKLVREPGDELFFLYVVNIEFLDNTARAVRPDIVEAEMEKLGRFLLEMARERAAEQGVKAEVMLRHGMLGEELAAVACELQVDTIMLGDQPREASTPWKSWSPLPLNSELLPVARFCFSECLIVLCSRGRSGLSRWLMGSVADRVVRGATVPVLLVRSRKEED